MKKILAAIFIIFFVLSPAFAFGKKKQKPVLYMAKSITDIANSTAGKENFPWVFKTNERIYFQIINPKGFKSDFIKYQIIKQDDNAHVGGYTRIRNLTVKVKSKYDYTDYFVLSEKGKYFLQVFDIENLQQWIAIGSFLIVE